MSSGTVEDVQRRLERFLPFADSSEKLRRQPFYVVYKIHVYSRDVLTAIVGLGIAPPAAVLLSRALGGSNPSQTATQNLFALPTVWVIMVGILVLLSVIMRVYITVEQVEKRAVLARSCRNEFRGLTSKVFAALETADPSSEIIQAQNKATEIVSSASGGRVLAVGI